MTDGTNNVYEDNDHRLARRSLLVSLNRSTPPSSLSFLWAGKCEVGEVQGDVGEGPAESFQQRDRAAEDEGGGGERK